MGFQGSHVPFLPENLNKYHDHNPVSLIAFSGTNSNDVISLWFQTQEQKLSQITGGESVSGWVGLVTCLASSTSMDNGFHKDAQVGVVLLGPVTLDADPKAC